MRRFGIICLALAGALYARAAAQEDYVRVLNEDNFQETTRSNQYVFVMFHAPWCGHCKQFGPEFAAAARQLKDLSPPVVFAKVDATVETKLAEEYSIRGYPTIKLFIEGRDQEYTGGRTEETIVTWVLKKVGPPATRIEDAAAMERFERDHRRVVVGLFEDAPSAAFDSAARNFEDVMFAHSSTPAVFAKYGLSAPALRMLVPHDEKVYDFSGNMQSASEIEAWIKMYRVPLIQTFNGEMAAELFHDGRPLLFLFRNKDKKGEAAEKVLREAAPGLGRKLLVSIAGSSEPMDQRLMDYVAVEPTEFPTMRIVKNPVNGMLKYKLDGEITVASVQAFVREFEANTLKPFYRSEAAPQVQMGPVYQLVGNTFESIVKDTTKDVLVEFYAPWCGHCKKFEPVYREVAKKLSGVKTLLLAKIDGTANDVPGIDMEGFPMIKLWRADKKDEPLDFDRDRDPDSLVQWLEEHVAFSFNRDEQKSEL